MKKYLLKIALLLLIMVIGAFILDFMISRGLREMEDYRYQSWNDIYENRINADIIVNGNSRALSHFIPEIIDSCFQTNTYNLGIGGYPFSVQNMKYQFFLEHNKPPKVILQNVDFVTLNQQEIIGHEREQIFPFVFDDYLQKELPNYGISTVDVHIPLIRYFGYQMVIKNGLIEFLHLKHYKSNPSINGFYLEKGSWNSTELDKLQKIKFNPDSMTASLFENYLKDCSDNHIQVFLVNSPVFYRATNKLVDKAKMNNYYKTLAAKFGHVYLDYTNHPICNDSTNFVVAVHLNEEGAKKFTKVLVNDLDSIYNLRTKFKL